MKKSPQARSARWVSAIASCVALVAGTPGWSSPTETLLYSFGFPGPDGTVDGIDPVAGLVADAAGNFYGTTSEGGAFGRGIVFKIAPSGAETVLYSFGSFPGDGVEAFAGLILDTAGNLYGTTARGGAFGRGTVFELTPSGAETVLYSFGGYTNDGLHPNGGLIADSAGNLYGTTMNGGASNFGTVFEVTQSGTETVLYSFAGAPNDGAGPVSGLIFDGAGNLYGTTANGGTSDFGTVFELTPAGVETVLYSFSGSDGDGPVAGLIADAAGNLYGTTSQGGAFGFGTVFELAPSGTETVLHSFAGPFSASPGGGDGTAPVAGLIADSAGNLYGTTGDSDGDGIVFSVTPGGVETILLAFDTNPHDNTTGSHPKAGLVVDNSGNLYGTTVAGGTRGDGTVFKLSGTGFVTPLAALLTEVTGVGPGTSLADKVTLAQMYYSTSDIPDTCSTLSSIVHEVNAQDGKTISQSLAVKLVSDSQKIQTAIGCTP